MMQCKQCLSVVLMYEFKHLINSEYEKKISTTIFLINTAFFSQNLSYNIRTPSE